MRLFLNPVFILGLVNLVLIAFLIASGLRLVKVRHVWHRRAGIALAVFSVLHALIAVLINQ